MAFGSSRLRRLVLAGQMHEIGKIGLPPYILTKPGKLTDEEWAAIKLPPAKGWEIVGRAKALKDIASIVRHHHERFDGSGYPDGLPSNPDGYIKGDDSYPHTIPQNQTITHLHALLEDRRLFLPVMTFRWKPASSRLR